MKFPKI